MFPKCSLSIRWWFVRGGVSRGADGVGGVGLGVEWEGSPSLMDEGVVEYSDDWGSVGGNFLWGVPHCKC